MNVGAALVRTLLGVLAVTLVQATVAQSYPNRPIRIVVDTTTGGTNDIWSRRYGQRLTEALGQPVVIENRPGASGTIAAESVAKAPADGHTLFYGGMGALVAYPAAGGPVRYDPVKDFVPIAMGTMGAPMVVISPRLGLQTLAQLVEYGRAHPDGLTCGTGGHASNQHFACVQFAQTVGIKTRSIAYKGGAAALMDAASGEVSMAIGWSSELEPFISGKRLVPVAALAASRQPKFPDVPTVAEAGFPALEFNSFSGFYAPAGTPGEIVDRLSTEVLRVASLPEVKALMDQNGGIYLPYAAADFSDFVRTEQAEWRKMSEETGIRVE